MSNFSRKFICRLLFFVLIGLFVPLSHQSDFAAEDIVGVKAGNFAPGQLEEHYLKHGYQFGQITRDQYLQGAQALLDAAPGKDVLEKIRPNGDVEHFRESTGELAIMTKRGRIRTYFKADYWYWMTH